MCHQKRFEGSSVAAVTAELRPSTGPLSDLRYMNSRTKGAYRQGNSLSWDRAPVFSEWPSGGDTSRMPISRLRTTQVVVAQISRLGRSQDVEQHSGVKIPNYVHDMHFSVCCSEVLTISTPIPQDSIADTGVIMWWQAVTLTNTSRALMEGINMEKSSQGCYKAMQLSQ